MNASLTKLREKKNSEGGFTLIELLVVVVIIGILVAIAIPLYLNFRKGAENRSAQSDVRNAVASVEQCYSEANQVMPASHAAATANFTLSCSPGTDQTIVVSAGNTLTYTLGASNTYTITGVNKDGAKTYKYDSSTGAVTTA